MPKQHLKRSRWGGTWMGAHPLFWVPTHTCKQQTRESLPKELAYLSDIGMTGSYAGVIGMDKADVIARFTSVTARRAEHSSGEVRICAAVIEIDETSGRAQSIARLNLAHEQ